MNCEGTKEADHEEAAEYEDDGEILSDENSKIPLSLLLVPKFQSLFKNFKNLSQLFGKFKKVIDANAKSTPKIGLILLGLNVEL